MIHNKREFGGGVALLVAFFVVLFLMFQPMFNGHNAMEYLDNLYNSISKGSVDYAPGLKAEAARYNNKSLDLKLTYASEIEAQQSADLFKLAGAVTDIDGKTLHVSGSLGLIMDATLTDSNLLYHNDSKSLEEKYGIEGRRVLYNWWSSYKLIDKGLTKQKEFEAAKSTATISKKAVEASYNYFGVEPVNIMDELGLVIFSLAFYVIYTLWYGFAILFIFEGWGLKLSH